MLGVYLRLQNEPMQQVKAMIKVAVRVGWNYEARVLMRKKQKLYINSYLAFLYINTEFVIL